MANLPLEERMTPANEAKFREKIKIQQGMAKDIASSYGGKSSDYLKAFNKVNRKKIRKLQVGVVRAFRKRGHRFPESKLPLKKAA
jgi:hypothetical protein